MRYKAPYGSADPDASYVDKDVPGATAGSKVPRQAVEAPQREIGNAIDYFLGNGTWASGQDANDLTQLTKAMRRLSRGLSADLTVKGSDNTPPVSPAENDVWVCGAAATGAWAGQNNKIALYLASAWVFFTPLVGQQVNFRENLKFVAMWWTGTQWARLSSQNAITAAVTLNVATSGVASPANPLGGDAFDSLASAMAWLQDYTIIGAGAVTILFGTGVFTVAAQTDVKHPNADRITIRGAALPGSFATATDCVSTLATARSNLRAKMGTVLSLSGVTGLAFTGSFALVERLMLDHSGAGSGLQATATVQNGLTIFRNCIFFGCRVTGGQGNGVTVGVGGVFAAQDCIFSHCDTGIAVRQGGYGQAALIAAANTPVMYCGSGLAVQSNSQFVLVDSMSFQNATVAAINVSGTGSVSQTGGTMGFASNQINVNALGGRAELTSVSMGAPVGSFSFVANVGGYISVPNSGTVTSSPANNTVGNANSYVRVF